MRFLRQSLTGVFLTALALAFMVYAVQNITSALETRMSNQGRAPTPRERMFTVNVVPAVPEQITPVLEAFGEIHSRRTLELRATTTGRVIWLDDRFEEGGTVETGDILVRIDPSDAQAVLDRAASAKLDAEAEVRDANRSLDLARDELTASQDQADLREKALSRQLDLQARGVGTAAAVETAELSAASARQAVLSRRIAVAQAEARVDQAATSVARQEITLADAERDLEDTIITAGFTGTLSEVDLVAGRLVTQNEKLAKIVDSKALEVSFRVSTAQYARLLDAEGQLIKAQVEARLDISGVDLRAKGRVNRDSIVTGQGQSGRVLFARLDSAPGFKPGDFVTVQVQEPTLDDVVRLPSSAIDAASTVLVLGPEDRLEALPVTLLRRQRDDVIVTGEGLAGREVVIGRTPLLGVGIKVRPLRPVPVPDPAAQSAVQPGDGTTAKSSTQTPAQTPAQPQFDEPEMVALSDEQRQKMRAFIEGNNQMPKAAKERVLTLLDQPTVPARLVQRITSRMGG